MSALLATGPLAKSIASQAANGSASNIKELMKGRRDCYMLNPFDIEIEPGFNARDVESPKVQEHIDGLAQSIQSIGLQRPLKVRMKLGRAKLVDGECRLRAVIRAIEHYGAEIVAVPVQLTDKSMSDADATLSLIVENGGLELNALEKASVFKRLVSYGWTITDIAERAGLSGVRVTQLVELAGVPDSIKDMIRGDEIAPTLAWTIAKENDFDETATLACIKKALTEAQGQGKKRVTQRYVGGGNRTSFKQSVIGIIGHPVDICEDEEGDQTLVVVTYTREQFDQLQLLTKLSLL